MVRNENFSKHLLLRVCQCACRSLRMRVCVIIKLQLKELDCNCFWQRCWVTFTTATPLCSYSSPSSSSPSFPPSSLSSHAFTKLVTELRTSFPLAIVSRYFIALVSASVPCPFSSPSPLLAFVCFSMLWLWLLTKLHFPTTPTASRLLNLKLIMNKLCNTHTHRNHHQSSFLNTHKKFKWETAKFSANLKMRNL